MNLYHLYQITLISIFIAGLFTFVSLLFINAPYGRHYRVGWGLSIPNQWGWILMESPAVLVFLWVYLSGDYRAEFIPLCLLALWQIHYCHRTFIFPFRLRSRKKRMPLIIALIAFLFNAANGFINAYWISHLSHYTRSNELSLLIGIAIFFLGFYVNYRSDRILFSLRKDGESGYQIPQGFLYRWIVSPNYFGEILEWVGFAIASSSPAAWVFAFYTAANLVPRALSHLRWYKTQFSDFPTNRKALIPFLF